MSIHTNSMAEIRARTVGKYSYLALYDNNVFKLHLGREDKLAPERINYIRQEYERKKNENKRNTKNRTRN